MEPEKKEPQAAPGEGWAQVKKTAKFWLPACLSLTALLLIFSILLTYVLATDAQRKRDLQTIAEQKEAEEKKQEEEQPRPDNLALLESILQDRALYAAETQTEDFLRAVFELYQEKSGDRYAAYYTEDEYKIRMSQLSGQTVGIGVTVNETTVLYEGEEVPALLLRSVISESSAAESGLIAGEWIIAISDETGELQSIETLGGYSRAILSLRGEEGSEVILRVLSETEETFLVRDVACVRRQVQSETVSGALSESDPTVAVIRIREFSFQTPAQFRAVFAECRGQGATKFVLDLRDNAGGSLIALSATLSGFLQSGDVIYSERYADGKVNSVFCAPRAYEGEKAACSVTEEQIGEYRDPALSFVVLCNERTASAAELFVATLSESGVAGAVFGQKTTGKWIAQSNLTVPFNGFNGYISFTVYQCFTKGGASYQEIGFVPDHEVALAPGNEAVAVETLAWEDDLQLQAAIDYFLAN